VIVFSDFAIRWSNFGSSECLSAKMNVCVLRTNSFDGLLVLLLLTGSQYACATNIDTIGFG